MAMHGGKKGRLLRQPSNLFIDPVVNSQFSYMIENLFALVD